MKKYFTLYFVLVTLSLTSQTPSFVWAKQFGGPTNENEHARTMITDNAGNIYIAGSFAGTTDFDPGVGTFNLSTAGGGDIFVCKLAASGSLIWAKRLGGSGEDEPKALALDASGNLCIAGFFNSIDADFDPDAGTFTLAGTGFYSDSFVCKLDSDGNFVWAKQIAGPNNEYAMDMVTDATGNMYVTGLFLGPTDFDPGASSVNLTADGYDAFILKLGPAGNFIWVKQIGGVNNEEGECIAVDAAGNIYTTGQFGSPDTDLDPGPGTHTVSALGILDVYITKLDAAGNFVWGKQIGSSGFDESVDLKIDPSGNLCLAGNFENTIDLDPGASVLNFTSAGLDDFFISKLNPSGTLSWARAFGGTGNDHIHSLYTDVSGDMYTSGTFQSTAMDMDPGAATYNLSASTGVAFISKLDGDGNFSWAGSFGGNEAGGHEIAVDGTGNIYTTGYFNDGPADFDPGTGTIMLTASHDDVFILKLSSSLTDISEYSKTDNGFNILPNPTTGIFSVIQNAATDQIEVYDTVGKVIYSVSGKESKIIIDLSDNPDGMYFVKVTSEKGTVTKRIIKY